jgi:hypothetical protein
VGRVDHQGACSGGSRGSPACMRAAWVAGVRAVESVGHQGARKWVAHAGRADFTRVHARVARCMDRWMDRESPGTALVCGLAEAGSDGKTVSCRRWMANTHRHSGVWGPG